MVALAFVLGALAGCGTLPPPALYTLDAGDPVESTACREAAPTLLVATVVLPEYSDRDQFVRRVADHQLALDDDNHWAERPSVALTRIFAAALTKTYCVQPATAASAADELQVSLSVFEWGSGGSARLAGTWRLLSVSDDTPVRSGTIDQRIPSRDGSIAGEVAAMNEAATAAAAAIARDTAPRR